MERPDFCQTDRTFLPQCQYHQHDRRHAQHKADDARQPRYAADAHRVKALKRGDRIRKRDKRQSRNKLTGIRTDHAQRTVTAEKCTDNKSDAAQKDQKIQCGLESLIQLDTQARLARLSRSQAARLMPASAAATPVSATFCSATVSCRKVRPGSAFRLPATTSWITSSL